MNERHFQLLRELYESRTECISPELLELSVEEIHKLFMLTLDRMEGENLDIPLDYKRMSDLCIQLKNRAHKRTAAQT